SRRRASGRSSGAAPSGLEPRPRRWRGGDTHEGALQLRPLRLLDAGGGRLRDRRGLELSRVTAGTPEARKGVSSVKARCAYARYICSMLAAVGFAAGTGGGTSWGPVPRQAMRRTERGGAR